MQDLLSGLQPALVIALIVAGILILVAVVLLARRIRNRQAPADEGVASGLGGSVDYTSLPLDEEPSGWRERFARLSLAGRILAVVVPILAILGLLALILMLQTPPAPVVTLPTTVPVSLRVRDAAVIRAEPMTVDIRVESTGLEDGAVVTAELLEDGEPFGWLNSDQTTGRIRANRVEIQAQRAPDAPQPSEGRTYTVLVRGPANTASEPVPLVVPSISGIADSFYGLSVAAPPPTPTAEPTMTPEPAPEPEPEPVLTPEPELPTGPAATVVNGGNVRSLPVIANNVIGGIAANEQVQLIERTPNALWFRVRTVGDVQGWVSASLISVPPNVQVPVAAVVTVFVSGDLLEQPDAASARRDQVVRDEVVQLLSRTAAGDWYEVRNMRDVQGWVAASLLGVPPEVASAVPVAP